MSKKKKKRKRIAKSKLGKVNPAASSKIYALTADHILKSLEHAAHKMPSFENPHAKFDECIGEVVEIIRVADPLTLLCSLSYYNLTTPANVPYSQLMRVGNLTQGHLEILQALIVRELDRIGPIFPPTQAQFEEISEALYDAFVTFSLKRLSPKDGLTPEQKVQESIRLHTQGIRNVGYPQQILSMCKGIFSPISRDCSLATGLDLSQVADWLFAIEAFLATRINDYRQKLFPLMVARNMDEALSAIDQLYGESADNREFFKRASLDQAKFIVSAHQMLFLPSVFKLTIADFEECFPGHIDEPRLRELVDRLSFSAKGIKKPIEYLFLDNPVQKRPFIKCSDEHWVCALPNLLIGGCLDILEELIAENKGIKEAGERQRASFLERETEHLFQAGFPTGKVIRNAKFDIPGASPGEADQGESDVVVLLPPYIIIANCKGHRIPPEARRGAPSLKETIQEIVVEPAQQSKQLADELLKQGCLTLKSASGEVVIDKSDYSVFVPLSVVLESMCPMTANIPSLVEAGFVSKESARAPVMVVTDLECVLDILPSESQRLHYLIMRDIVERENPFVSDELGLLRIYLDNSLLTPIPDEFRDLPIMDLYGDAFEPYFMQQWTGQKVRKPKHQITQFTTDLIKWLEREKPSNWRAVAQTFLHLGPGSMKELEGRIAALRRKVRKKNREKPNNVIRLGVKSRNELSAILFFLHPETSGIESMMESITRSFMEELNCSSGTILWLDTSSGGDYPVSLVKSFGALGEVDA